MPNQFDMKREARIRLWTVAAKAVKLYHVHYAHADKYPVERLSVARVPDEMIVIGFKMANGEAIGDEIYFTELEIAMAKSDTAVSERIYREMTDAVDRYRNYMGKFGREE